MTVSFLEIYNEQLEDLLNPCVRYDGEEASPPRGRELRLVDDRLRGTLCAGLRCV